MALLHETTPAIVRDWFCNRLNPCHVIIPVRRLRTSRCSSGYKLLCCKLGHELDLSRVRVIPPVSADPGHVLLPLVCFQLPGQQCCVQTHDVEISAPSRSTRCRLRDVRQSYERDTGSDQPSSAHRLCLYCLHTQTGAEDRGVCGRDLLPDNRM